MRTPTCSRCRVQYTPQDGRALWVIVFENGHATSALCQACARRRPTPAVPASRVPNPDRLLTNAETALALGISPNLLEKRRQRDTADNGGRSPVPVRYWCERTNTMQVGYRPDDVRAFLDSERSWVTQQEAADRLGVTVAEVRTMLRTGRLKSAARNGQRIHTASLDPEGVAA